MTRTRIRTRLTKEHRKAQLIDAARKIAFEQGLYQVSMNTVATAAGCTRSNVRHYFPSAVKLRKIVLRRAINDGELTIINMALAMKDPMVDDLNPALHARCRAHLGE